ncbi:ribbon-helix-helix domain-containing protein [Sphingomonas mollis]|uniref:Ribbon-helix-helix domain-containing protein n=1 Tax=Sphingomonas mollis TaxID=2795726 RepID=A0ABS0XS96_9SPHN|nr:ribbon-helix-helix domain-containing protein [Sphingomonas sp. BT553]MBJ6122924.1 ribbon-helix-helix domain-containing protein [Sphingomonas sp. BT553]
MTGIAAPAGGFVGPVKRSVTIAGHQTSISLEPVFWAALEAAAAKRSWPLSAVVAQVDALRLLADDPPNLASALRSWLFAQKANGVSDEKDDTFCDSDENHSQ